MLSSSTLPATYRTFDTSRRMMGHIYIYIVYLSILQIVEINETLTHKKIIETLIKIRPTIPLTESHLSG